MYTTMFRSSNHKKYYRSIHVNLCVAHVALCVCGCCAFYCLAGISFFCTDFCNKTGDGVRVVFALFFWSKLLFDSLDDDDGEVCVCVRSVNGIIK